jgi:hypothetical protein
MFSMLVVTNGTKFVEVYASVYVTVSISKLYWSGCWYGSAGLATVSFLADHISTFFSSFVQFLIIFTFWGFSRILGIVLVATCMWFSGAEL